MTATVTTPIERLRDVCHPARFPGMSGKMAAILACLLGVVDGWTAPIILGLKATSDGVLIAYTVAGDGIEGSVANLRANIRQLYEATQGSSLPMTALELRYLLGKVNGLRA